MTENTFNSENAHDVGLRLVMPDHGTSLFSFYLSVTQRMCKDCKKDFNSNNPDKKEVSRTVRQISKHCSKEETYIASRIPLAEAIFRELLAVGIKPTNAGAVAEALMARWAATPTHPRVSGEVVARLAKSLQDIEITNE